VPRVVGSKGKLALLVCVEVGFEQVMLGFRIDINERSVDSRIAAAAISCPDLRRLDLRRAPTR
jgi:hypothetical protein